jgi:thiamine-phosphate pyrophosphorylase
MASAGCVLLTATSVILAGSRPAMWAAAAMRARTEASGETVLFMAGCYSAMMRQRHPPHSPIPAIWLMSDQRNDAVLAWALARLPRGSGFIFRHHHLPPRQRLARFSTLARAARARGHSVILAGTMREARRAGADGTYGPAARLVRGGRGLRLVTAHSLREIAKARRRADAILLSPVFPTRSHPGAKVLGGSRFRLLARLARVPVIALGGMNIARARSLRWPRWAAIDGLS